LPCSRAALAPQSTLANEPTTRKRGRRAFDHGWHRAAQIPNIEIRNKSEARSTNRRRGVLLRASDFEFVSDFDIRISDFMSWLRPRRGGFNKKSPRAFNSWAKVPQPD
jgi:hypothetical protein